MISLGGENYTSNYLGLMIILAASRATSKAQHKITMKVNNSEDKKRAEEMIERAVLKESNLPGQTCPLEVCLRGCLEVGVELSTLATNKKTRIHYCVKKQWSLHEKVTSDWKD